MKILLMIIGIVAIILGIIGVFLPLLPTTPFLILASYCFAKSSIKFQKKLYENKMTGKYLKDYIEKKGICLKNKIISISMILLSLTYSLYKIENDHIKIVVTFMLTLVIFHIVKIKTIKD